MSEIQFKGKEFVFNHHLSVPYRPLVPNDSKSIGSGNLNENLIVHGDNLHALKALMPMYAGKVDCIFIDPPYNTGNEGWSYNDNVNSPMILEWLNSNPINKEDMLKHDKWLALMYPRLKLLHELLAEDGSFWMTLDDNEIHRARMVMDEIFGESGFVATVAWQARYSVSNDASVSNSHNYILVYSKAPETWKKLRNKIARNDKQTSEYSNNDGDPNGPWRSIPWDAPEVRENLAYPIKTTKGTLKYPPKGRHWAREESQWFDLVKSGLAYFGKNGDGSPAYKKYLKDAETVVPTTWWPHELSGHTDEASKELTAFGLDLNFETPKPVRLIERILSIATKPDSIILDSFAGSGTTAHAVLNANKKDDGYRKFILVECEDYADKLTAERVRKVIEGYAFKGTQKEMLYTESISFTSLKNPTKILDQISSIENLEGHRFDTIKKEIKDDTLTVIGEKKITDKVEGIGGSFTYCTLGDPIDIDKILTGENLPDYRAIGAWLFHTATSEALNVESINQKTFFLGESSSYFVWMIYKPNLEFLKSRESALTLAFAENIAKDKSKRHLVFAPAKYVPNKTLLPLGVEYAPLPFALFRVEK
jgi:adenine-specific DNA-methyltransferase